MKKRNWEGVAEELAKVGFEKLHDAKWDELPKMSIERIVWHNIAIEMINKLWEVYKKEKSNGR